MKHWNRIWTAALVTFVVAGVSLAANGTFNPVITRAGLMPSQIPSLAIACTQGAQTYYLNTTTGNDSNPCTSPGTGACATTAGVMGKVPRCIKDPTTISVAVADAGIGGFDLSGFILMAPVDGGSTNLHILGETLVDASGLSGPVTGTAVSGSNTGGLFGTWCTLTTTGGLTSSQLQGYLIELTGGSGAGDVRVIDDNDTTTISMVGACTTAPSGTTTYRVRDPIFVTSAVSLPNVLDGGTTTAGIFSTGGWSTMRPAQNGYVRFSNIGVNLTASAAIRATGTGRIGFQRGRFLGGTAAAAAAIVSDLADFQTNDSAYVANGFQAYNAQNNAAPSSFSFTRALFLGGTSTPNAAINLGSVSAGSSSASSVRVRTNTASYACIDPSGSQNVQLGTMACRCAGTNNYGIRVLRGGTGGTSGIFGLAHFAADGCGRAVSIGAPFTVSGTELEFTNLTLGIHLSYGGRFMTTNGVNTTSVTNYADVDGTVIPTYTDLSTTYGTNFLGLVSGAFISNNTSP